MTTTANTATAAPPASVWSPLRSRIFRAIWIAGLASNVGSWMHLVAAQWEMTSLSPSAALVGLLSTAGALPAFALALPAGALADVVDRRRLILVAQAWQFVAAALLGTLTVLRVVDPAILLGATFLLGFGASLGLPAFSAITSELVERAQLPAAISLNSVSTTLSQAVGPAIGGLLVASLGSGGVFLVNAASFLGIIAVLVAWRRTPPAAGLPPEHVVGAVRSGLRYVAGAPELRGVLARLAAYVLGYSALPVLLAVLTRTRFDADATTFGLLLGCLGLGGVIGASILPGLRGRYGPDRVVGGCTLLAAASIAAVALAPSIVAVYPVMTLLGVVSIGTISSFMIAAQAVLPAWVRGRGLAMMSLVFQATFAIGAAAWGVVAVATGAAGALLAAALVIALSALLGIPVRLRAAEELDGRAGQALEVHPPASVAADDGPVQLSVSYLVADEDLPAFTAAAGRLRTARYRSGAMRWCLYTDAHRPGRRVETFTVASWEEHLRQGERETASDRRLADAVTAFHRGEEPPQQEALVSERRPRGQARAAVRVS